MTWRHFKILKWPNKTLLHEQPSVSFLVFKQRNGGEWRVSCSPPPSFSKWPSTDSIALSAGQALGCSTKRVAESISNFLRDCQTAPHHTAPRGWWSHCTSRVPTTAPCGIPKRMNVCPEIIGLYFTFHCPEVFLSWHLFSSRENHCMSCCFWISWHVHAPACLQLASYHPALDQFVSKTTTFDVPD